MKKFSVDNQSAVTLLEIVSANDLDSKDIKRLDELEPGESCFIEITEVKRIK